MSKVCHESIQAVFALLGVLAVALASLTGLPRVRAAVTDAVNVGFAGLINDGQYNTAGSDEHAYGALTPAGGANQPTRLADTAGLALAGGTQYMVFEAAQDQYRLGTEGGPVATSFRAEIEVKPAASQVELGTIFSSGGNIFVRYLDTSTIQWGYSSNTGGAWQGWKATTAAPAAGAPFVAQVEYLAGSSGGRMELLINGQSRGVVVNNEGLQAHLASGQAATYGFGGEINVDAEARGFVGELHRIRIGSPESPWEFAAPDPALVNLNFDGARVVPATLPPTTRCFMVPRRCAWVRRSPIHRPSSTGG